MKKKKTILSQPEFFKKFQTSLSVLQPCKRVKIILMSVVVSTNRDEKLKINVSKPILASEIGQFFMSAG